MSIRNPPMRVFTRRRKSAQDARNQQAKSSPRSTPKQKKVTCTTAAYCEVCKSNYGNPDTKAHALEHHDAKAATCLEKGWKAYDTCKRCDYSTCLIRLALGHDKVKHDAKNPTCLEIGWKAYDTCTRCDYTTYQELKALGHDKVKHAAKNPTCTDYGWYAYDTCTRCDYSTCLIRPALGHDKVNPPALRSAGRRMTPVRGATIPPTRSCLPSATTTRSACTR